MVIGRRKIEKNVVLLNVACLPPPWRWRTSSEILVPRIHPSWEGGMVVHSIEGLEMIEVVNIGDLDEKLEEVVHEWL